MNHFLVYDSDVSSYRQTGILTTGGVGSRRGVDVQTAVDISALGERILSLETADTSTATDELLERADALEAYTTILLERIRILQDVSYTNPAYNANTKAAQRRIAIEMPYPSYMQISTVSIIFNQLLHL